MCVKSLTGGLIIDSVETNCFLSPSWQGAGVVNISDNSLGQRFNETHWQRQHGDLLRSIMRECSNESFWPLSSHPCYTQRMLTTTKQDVYNKVWMQYTTILTKIHTCTSLFMLLLITKIEISHTIVHK